MLRQRIVSLIVLLAVVLCLGLAVRFVPDLQWLVDREQALRQAVETAPLLSWILGLAVYILLSLVPGTAGKSVVCGWLFGLWPAVLMVNIGLTATAVLSFLLARFVFAKFVLRGWHDKMRILNGWFQREGAFALLALRMVHAPFTVVNYCAGATRIPLRTFWWTTHLGILPGTLVFTFAGTRIPSLKEVVLLGPWALLDGPLLAALGFTAAVPFVVRLAMRRAPWKSGELQLFDEPAS